MDEDWINALFKVSLMKTVVSPIGLLLLIEWVKLAVFIRAGIGSDQNSSA